MARRVAKLTKCELMIFACCIGVFPAHALDDAANSQMRLVPEADQKVAVDNLVHVATRVFALSPKSAETADATHAALLITNKSYSGDISFAGRVQTVKQLRVGYSPNPWECAWLVWNYQDEHHFYYVAIKPTGWEIGKRDPAYVGGQRFLASGSEPFPIGAWHDFLIVQTGNLITVHLNGTEIASYADSERPYTNGHLGLYTEDAEVHLDEVVAPFSDDFEDYRPMAHNTDGAIINKWFSPFLGYGHVAVVDRRR
jgi:hypothetical protein